MINRVLIRMKVVQMLYSYLLTRSDFKIDEAPESASRDRRYAYTAYINFILLLMELSGYSVKNGQRDSSVAVNQYLIGNKVAKELSSTDAIRSAILRGNTGVEVFDPLLEDIIRKITQSEVYKDYKSKKDRQLPDDVTFWCTVFETIIAKDPQIAAAMRSSEAFTQKGMEMAIENLCNTLRSYSNITQTLSKAAHDLQESLNKAYELYLGLIDLPRKITRELQQRQEAAKNRYIVTSEDLNPNTRLVENALMEYLNKDEEFEALLKKYKVDLLSTNSILVRVLLDKILASDLYKEYIEKPVTDFQTDVDFWRDVMRNIILPSDELADELEDKSVYWNDDVQIMGTFVLKTLKQISSSEGRPVSILPQYKDEEDRRFGNELFMDTIKHEEEYREYVNRFIDRAHWDTDRIAFMDIVIMITAIAEIIKYPAIPLAVSINEYVEIANNYSTDKSGAFVNGILFSVSNYLREKGIINKN